MHRLRGPRRRRQGRHDQSDHGAREPADLSRRRTSRPNRAREVADVRAAIPAAPAGGRRGRHLGPQLVQPRRRRAGDGLLLRGSREEIPECVAGVREAHGRFRDHPAQVLARGEPRGADAPARSARRRRPQDLEALADGHQVLHALGRLHEGARRHVRGERHRVGAVVRRKLGGQEACPAQHHLALALAHSVRSPAAREGEAAEAQGARATAGRSVKRVPDKF